MKKIWDLLLLPFRRWKHKGTDSPWTRASLAERVSDETLFKWSIITGTASQEQVEIMTKRLKANRQRRMGK